MRLVNPVKKSPNAAVAGGTTLVALLPVWIAGHFGISLSAEDGLIIGGILSTIVLAIGHDGIIGVSRVILHGRGDQ